MKKLIYAAIIAACLGAGWGAHATAAPITCPGAQVATKTSDFWSCVNPAGHEDGSGADKNPNGHPNT